MPQARVSFHTADADMSSEPRTRAGRYSSAAEKARTDASLELTGALEGAEVARLAGENAGLQRSLAEAQQRAEDTSLARTRPPIVSE